MTMANIEIPVGSRDGRGAGDHDLDYPWGNPKAGLTTIEQGWLTILRGDLMNVRRGETVRGMTADRDLRGEPWP